ncbi:MAG: O-antigen ligase family protein [Clostridia bacterium]|nr:O-antigen ligase family protein [Clostridia bacterium]
MKKRNVKTGSLFMHALKTSIFAALFTSYKSREKDAIRNSSIGRRIISPAFGAVSSAIFESRASQFFSFISKLLLSVRLRVYGTFLLSFGLYSAIFYSIDNFALSEKRVVTNIVIGIIIAASSVPVVSSDESLSGALISSKFGAFILRLTGTRPETVKTDEVRGKANHGFLLGVAAGVASYFSSPLEIVMLIVAVIVVRVVFSSPEFGFALALFLIPFIRTEYLIALCAVTLASFLLKVVRGKRYITIETIDVSVIGFFLLFIFSSVSALTDESRKISLTFALLILMYFAGANLLRNKKFIDAASSSFVYGMTAAALIVALSKGAYYLGFADFTAVSGIFEGSILGDRIASADPSTFNMLLVAALPAALARFVSHGAPSRRIASAAAMIIMAFPLAEFRSAFALFSVVSAMILLLIIYSSKFILLPVCSAVVLGAASFVFPALSQRITTFLGNGLDSFSAVRSSAWKDAFDIISRSFAGGIGFGKEVFDAASAAHFQGASGASHAYNTYLQIWIECGMIGFFLIVLFAWYLITSSFTAIDLTDRAKESYSFGSSMASRMSGNGTDTATSEFSISHRMSIAASFCGVTGLLIYGAADHIFDDARVFLAFWMTAGITSAAVRYARRDVHSYDVSEDDRMTDNAASEAEVRLR